MPLTVSQYSEEKFFSHKCTESKTLKPQILLIQFISTLRLHNEFIYKVIQNYASNSMLPDTKEENLLWNNDIHQID